VENDGSNCLNAAVGWLDRRMLSAGSLHHMRFPVAKGTPVTKVDLLENRGAGSASPESGVCQHRRKQVQWCQSRYVKPWTKVPVW
jgi:hypothetical protein